jgi:peptidoglycan/LPS O-acetylase OafA/YrhL
VSGRRASSDRPARQERLEYLDSLRAVAVLVVFVMHVTEVFIRITPKQPDIFHWAYELSLGRVGVVTFFAISGFLIPSSLRGPTGPGLLRFLITGFAGCIQPLSCPSCLRLRPMN